MAIATGREYGLFINGESTEPASGEIRELSEPATGEPLARVQDTKELPAEPVASASTSANTATVSGDEEANVEKAS